MSDSRSGVRSRNKVSGWTTSPPGRSYPVGLINEKLRAWSALDGACEPAWPEKGMNGYGMGGGYGLVNQYGQYPGQPTTYTTVDAAGNLHRVTSHVVNNGYVATTPSRPMMPLW